MGLPTLKQIALHVDHVLRDPMSRTVSACGQREKIRRSRNRRVKKTYSEVTFKLRATDGKAYTLCFGNMERITYIFLNDAVFKNWVEGGRYKDRRTVSRPLRPKVCIRSPNFSLPVRRTAGCLAKGELWDFANQTGEYEPVLLHEAIWEDPDA